VPSTSAKENAQRWSGRRLLVTGAAGFIGSHLTEALVRAGASVRAFVRYNSRGDCGWLELCEPEVFRSIEVFRGDLANPEAVTGAMTGQHAVLHLGALVPIPYSYRHPREFVTANVTATLNILEAARRLEVDRVVHTSTSEVYGTAMTVPIGEQHPLHPQSPYAATKVAADQLALSYHRSFDTPVVIARPFNTYGPRQSARAVIPTIVAQALSRELIELGATHPTRDFLHVEDTVGGIMRCATAEGIEGEVINLGTGVEVSIAQVVDHVLRLLEREVPVALDADRLRPAESEVERLLADPAKAKALIGWEPEVDLVEGLRRTIDWMTDSLGSYKPSIYNI
jgi:NAD dependent epimerase/dehydratase